MAITAPGFLTRGTRPIVADYVLLHFVILIWGITAILGKLISLDPGVLTAWRTGLAAVTLFLITRARKLPWPGGKDVVILLATGLLIGLHWFLFFLSARLGTVSGSLAGVATAALWVALLEPLLIRGRRWSWAEGVLATGVTSGVMIIQFSDRGLLPGIASAAVAATFSIINARLVRRHSALMITTLEMTGACFLCVAGTLILTPADGAVQWWPSAADWPWILVLSLVCTVFAYSACVWIQRRISAFSLGMASNLEPVYGMALAPLVFGAVEHQPLRFYAGAAVIIGFVAIHTVLTQRQLSRPSAAPSGAPPSTI